MDFDLDIETDVIKVTSQKEFDELPNSYDDFVDIEINSSEPLVIKRDIKGATYVLKGETFAEIQGNTPVELLDSSSANVDGEGEVDIVDEARANVFGKRDVTHFSDGRVEVFEDAEITVSGSGRAVLRGQSRCLLMGDGSVSAYDESLCKVVHNGRVNIHDKSRVELFRESMGVVYSKEATIFAYESSIVNEMVTGSKIYIYDNSIKKNGTIPDVSVDDWISRGLIPSAGMVDEFEKLIETDGDIEVYKMARRGFVTRLGEFTYFSHTPHEGRIELKYRHNKWDESMFQDWKLTDTKTRDELAIAFKVLANPHYLVSEYFSRKETMKDLMSVQEAIEFTKTIPGAQKFKEFFTE